MLILANKDNNLFLFLLLKPLQFFTRMGCDDDDMINVPVLFCMRIEATGNTFFIMPTVNAIRASATVYVDHHVTIVMLIVAYCFHCAQ